ncbi:MAG: hypothetical protein IPM60_17240 [Rhodospirillales bacterium]|nr:hypothetical protein [Rhodospirillales bacterium]
MPLAGTGLLVNCMDIDPEHEPDFNRWYDKEHLAERVAIAGFLEARRYIAHQAPVKYLALYTTETFDVLSSPPYRERVAHQTQWSLDNIARFRNATRALVRVGASQGQGRGSAIVFARLRPSGPEASSLRNRIAERFPETIARDGIVSVHLLESDPELSQPLSGADAASNGAGDWYVVIDGTGVEAVRSACEDALRPDQLEGAKLIWTGTYRLLWDLSKAELAA